LEQWGKSRQFQAKWTMPKKEVRLSNSLTTLVFTVDSRKLVINGLNVWLSVPVALRNDAAYIGYLDITTVLEPLLSPLKNPPGKTIKTIVLDPGHGGKDPGNREGSHEEKKYTLLLAQEVSALLVKAGFKVSLTRTKDTFVELPARAEIARQRGADLLLSLHYNGVGGTGASAVKGVEVFCMTPARASSTNAKGEGASSGAYPGNRNDARNIMLAYQIQKFMVRNLGAEDRGVRRARFAVLRSAEMPAVLVEAGFMSNPVEAKKIYDPVHRRKLAQAIVDGVLAYKRIIGA